ncbi:hypothetical protein CVT24_008268 [Panaeolus cyanescens]|uniref:KOW domain-containing protein n=1 Tax=Panaeolus cyanescens TaxID=181874 RepID=A0A409W0H7_9AGAR|nr:hypothetical protein CVT24_008268 [Panaeolus cyanescens]
MNENNEGSPSKPVSHKRSREGGTSDTSNAPAKRHETESQSLKMQKKGGIPFKSRTPYNIHRSKGKQKPNIFIDIEAHVEDASDDEEGEGNSGNSMDEFVQDEDGKSDSEDTLPDDYELHRQSLQSADTNSSQRYWDDLLDRAYNRAKDRPQWYSVFGDDEDPEYTIEPNNCLWVVPCQTSHEMDAIFAIYNRATNPSSPHVAAPAAMFNPSQPGRIFIEAPSEIIARSTIDGLDGLLSNLLRPVPFTERRTALSTPPRHVPLWVRIQDGRRKWRTVNRSVALVMPLLNQRYLPEMWTVVVAFPAENGTYQWRRIHLDDIRFTTNIGELPTIRDLQRFSGCDLVNEYHLHLLFERIYRANIRPGARVYVTRGDFIGSVGEVMFSSGANVDLQIQDGSTISVPLKCVRRHFAIGDTVMIVTAPWKGNVGWVVSIDGARLVVWSDKEMCEYYVSSLEVEFFCTSFRHQIPSSQNQQRLQTKVHDAFQRFKGRRILITGHPHPLKGNQGYIKETHPDGRIWVQLDSIIRGNRLVELKHGEIHLIEDETEDLIPLTGKHPLIPIKLLRPPEPTTPQSSNNKGIGNPDGDLLSSVAASEGLPIVDDTVNLPDTSTGPPAPFPVAEPDWLDDAFLNYRIKLHYTTDHNRVVHLVGRGSNPGTVKIRDRTNILQVGLDAVAALSPTAPGDDVLVLRGAHAGSMFRVVEVRAVDSVVKKVGHVKRKNEPNPVFSNDCLVQAIGPFKRR